MSITPLKSNDPRPTLVPLPPDLYDQAKAAGYPMQFFVRQEPIPMIRKVPDLGMSTVAVVQGQQFGVTSRMPRKKQSYADKLDQRRKDRLREKRFTEMAQQMSPAQAREALARWAAAGGKL